MRHLVDALEGEVLRLEPRRRVAPQRLTHGQRVVEDAAALCEVEPGRFVFLALPSDAHAQVEAAARKDVDGRRRLGEDDRTAQAGQEDPGGQPHP